MVAIACATIGSRIRPRIALLTGCAGALAGAFVLFGLHAASPAFAILAASAVFGIPNGLNPVAEQASLAEYADVRYMGVASGLLRTAGYIGAMLASSLIAIAFSAGASDAALHTLALVLIGLAVVLVAIAAARSLPRAINSTK